MNQLIIETEKVGTSQLKMKVISQPDTIQRGCNEFFEHGGVILLSVGSPELSDLFRPGKIHIWVWGISPNRDHISSTHDFKTSARREEAIYRINKCIEQFNATLGESNGQETN